MNKRFLTLVPLFLLFVSLLTFTSAGTVSAHTATTAPQLQTILWVDAHGHIVRKVRVSASQAQVIAKQEVEKILLKHHQHASKTSSAPKPAALTPLINRVSNSSCAADTQGRTFFKLWNNSPVCFANAGDAWNLNIYDVVEITTGNNEGNFEFVQNGRFINLPGDGRQFCKGDYIFPNTSDGYFDDVIKVGIITPSSAPCDV